MRFEEHYKLIIEKVKAVEFAKEKDLKSVIADEAVKAIGQMLEADAAERFDNHLQSHPQEFRYCNRYHSTLYSSYQEAFSIYNDLGYLGENGEKTKKMLDILDAFIKHFELEWGMKIDQGGEKIE